jgi:amino acid adenylation domain-containing protein
MKNFSNFVEIVQDKAERQPDQTAYIFLKDGEIEESRLTYRELDIQAKKIAARLQSMGISGQRALLLYPPSLEYIAAFLGCLYAGVVAVPVYPPHPARLERTLPRLIGIAKNAETAVALTPSFILSIVEQMFPNYPIFQKIRWIASDQLDESLVSDWRYPDINGDTLAFLQYTSGSTGTPKGVMLTHANLLHNELLIHTAFDTINHSAAAVSWLPLYHDMGLIGCILQPLYIGISGILMSPAAFLQRPFRWLDAISRYKAMFSGGPNFAYDLCVRKIPAEQRTNLDLSHWQLAFNGSEPVRSDTLERFSEAFAPCGFRREAFYPCYGLAEATLMVSGGLKNAMPVIRAFDTEAMEQGRAIAADDSDTTKNRILVGSGKTILDQKIIIVNPDTSTRCSADEIGEIWVSGKSMAQGYWQMPEQTKEIFQAYLADTQEGPFLRTGDLGFLSDGELFITGRLKDLIIIRGRNHYPQDIELTVEKSHSLLRPGCTAAFVTMVHGEEQLFIAAEVERRYTQISKPNENRQYVVLPELMSDAPQPLNFKETFSAIRKAVSQQHDLHVYGILLLKVGTIPKTTSGKIQRHACKDGFLKKSLEIIGSSILNTIDISQDEPIADKQMLLVAPEKERHLLTESYLKHLISKIMKIDPSDIDPDQPLIYLGLDSLMAIELQHCLETQFDVVSTMAQFLQDISITRLTESILTHLKGVSAISKDKTVPVTERNPLSHNQKSLWFLHQLAPDSAAYNVFFTVRIASGLNTLALRRAFEQLILRHSSLRTTYLSQSGMPVQNIDDDLLVFEKAGFFEEIDASAWKESELRNRLIEESHRPFELEKGPVFRVLLYKRASDDHILLLNVHHISVDLWSLSVLLDELRILYSSDSPLPPLKASYHDFIRWQDDILSGSEGKTLRAYWCKKLSGELPILNLPTDYRRPPIQTYKGASYAFRIGKNPTRKIREIARNAKATMYMTLMAAFHVLLYRYTGQTDILVGSPAAGRSRAVFADIIGYFANPVVIRSELSDNLLFSDFLEQMRETILDALTYQNYPFQLLVEQLQPERDPSRSPLFQVMFVLEKPHRLQASAPFVTKESGARMNLGGLKLESLATDQRIAQFDMTLMMVEAEGGLSASLEYNTDLFTAATIRRMAEHFQNLLDSITSDPHQKISELSILSEIELRQLSEMQGDIPISAEKNIVNLIESQVETTPNHIALVSNDLTISFRELNERANRIAHFLIENYDIQSDDRIGVFLDRSEWVVIAMLGILKAGGAYVPIDPSYPGERVRYMLEDSACKAVLTEEKHIEFLRSFSDKDAAYFIPVQSIQHSDITNPPLSLMPDHLSYMIYTSGSTGSPKGVMQTHRCLSNLIQWQLHEIPPNGWRILQYAALGFDVSLQETLYSLASGSTLFVVPAHLRYDMPALTAFMREKKIDMLTMPFSALNLLFREGIKDDIPLRHIITSGEALRIFPELKDYLHRHPDTWLHNQYGPTETHVVTAYAINARKGNIDEYPPIGSPVSNTGILIADQQLHPVPIGVIGEIFVKGANLARGYLNRDNLTAEKFIRNPFQKQDRLYRTGDLGRWLPDGNIEFLGRNDDQVKIRGHRVELGEIENHLLKYEAVKEAVVVAKDFGDGIKELIAYVAVKEKLSSNALRDYLKTLLPGYMIPSYIVQIEKFLYTPNGKVDKRALPEPDKSGLIPEGEYAAPRNEIEEKLAGIWQQVLGLARIGIRDNFFEIGGHSLKAMQVISRIQKEFHVEIPVREIFIHPGIEQLSEVIRKAQPIGYKSIQPVPASEDELMALKKLMEDAK